MFKIRTRTHDLAVADATDAKVDGNGCLLIYKTVPNKEGKDYLLPVVIVSPTDWLTAYYPEHVVAVALPPPEKNGQSS